MLLHQLLLATIILHPESPFPPPCPARHLSCVNYSPVLCTGNNLLKISAASLLEGN